MRGAVLLAALAAARAHADPTVVLAEHEANAELVTEINLAPGQLAHPTSLAPDVWFGATARWTVGIVHSNPSVDRFSPGASFCVQHQDIGCHVTYHGSGLDVLYGARLGDFAVAPRARFLIRELDPFKPALTLGALLRWTSGRFAITGDPYLQLGLANIDQGNRHALFLPVTFAVRPIAPWELALRTGWYSDLAVVGDGYHIPVAVSTRVQLDPFELGLMLGFASLMGPQNTAKERALFFVVGWRG